MYEQLLPVGSVVLLKGADKRVTIIGRILSMAGGDKIYDYGAVPYPEGLTDLDSLVFFDTDDIDLLYFVGFQDSEELQFRSEVLANLGELYVMPDGRIAQRTEDTAAAAEPKAEPDGEAHWA